MDKSLESFKAFLENENNDKQISYTKNDDISLKWLTENDSVFKHELIGGYNDGNTNHAIFYITLENNNGEMYNRYVDLIIEENNLRPHKVTKNKSGNIKKVTQLNENEQFDDKSSTNTIINTEEIVELFKDKVYDCKLQL